MCSTTSKAGQVPGTHYPRTSGDLSFDNSSRRPSLQTLETQVRQVQREGFVYTRANVHSVSDTGIDGEISGPTVCCDDLYEEQIWRHGQVSEPPLSNNS